MKNLTFLLLLFLPVSYNLSQSIPFDYEVKVLPKSVSGLPGIHSYVYGQSSGKWLIIGGRRDGLHPRQPFNSFPANSNNVDILVIDPVNLQFWSSSVNQLPVGLAEQLQATNLNFHQDGDTLYIIGGYAYSATAQDHITFPNLTTVNVSNVINDVILGNPISNHFKQITDENFAVTGGQLGKIGDEFYLIGGHRFDGRYNPMGNPTYVQTYVDGIRKFKIDNSGTQLSYSNYQVITDQVHLHRRDYNLVAQIYPDGELGYMISSGVFQVGVDLPFLYPIEIKPSGYTPVTTFNQYLSNYHSPHIGVFDEETNSMHSIFLGGMSQYYYSNGALVEDLAVPFVKTISRVSRDENGNLQEVVFPNEMPALLGASAEFIPNEEMDQSENGVILLSASTGDSVLIGHVLGGIKSTELNPFSANNTGVTSAYNGIFEIWLKRSELNEINEIDGSNPFGVGVYPNPTKKFIELDFKQPKEGRVGLLITDVEGKIVSKQNFYTQPGEKIKLNVEELGLVQGTYFFNFVFDSKYSRIQKVIILK